MDMMKTKAELGGIVGTNAVIENTEPEIEAGPPKALEPMATMLPRVTVFPSDVTQVQKLVQWANTTSTPLVPVSSGRPHLGKGSQPSVPESVRVDLSRMNRVLKIDRRNRLALIQPGVTYTQLVPELKKEGLRINMPLMPKPNKSVIASLLEREPVMSPKFQWNLMEPLRSLEIVWGNGDHFYSGSGFFRGEKKSDWQQGLVPAQGPGAGPSQIDFYKFVSAAQGSMGIVTWASVRCEVLPQVRKIFFVSAQRLEKLVDFTYKLLKFRFADELFLVNDHCLATLLSSDPSQIRARRDELPPWSVVINITGGNYYPQEQVAAQENDIKDLCQQFGLDMRPEVKGCMGPELLKRLLTPSAEPHWRRRYKSHSEDIFFLSTLDKTPTFIETMKSLADEHRYPLSDMGVYLQPLHQGVCCHCEFQLPVDSGNPSQVAKAGKLFGAASHHLFRQGAFFSRPYGEWAQMMFNADAEARSALRHIKEIFDPNRVMNPGKLCF
jgi:FAD/FMN-containing dehydrogenase